MCFKMVHSNKKKAKSEAQSHVRYFHTAHSSVSLTSHNLLNLLSVVLIDTLDNDVKQRNTRLD